ncbi:GNAT family N-acetyltransferase [Actinocrispum sp. NPDC049592]|uniref:GNAT family N-acetyltransferase n=1 Tax=Actinocrispum sp. NPDC049592 TaxID=3154835 RepID=UPI003435AC63
MSLDAPVRRLDVAELPSCVELAVSRDWLPEEHKWRILFEVGDVFGVDAPDGAGLAGMVVLTRFGTEVAGIGMMVVAERYERRGLGARLMTHALQEAKTASVWLTATDYGRPLYARLGFRTISHSTQFYGRFERRAVKTSRPLSTSDMSGILRLDKEVFGAPRTELLNSLPSYADQFRVIDGPDGPAGFAAAWPNSGTTVVGPVVAADQDMALTLIAELGGDAPGTVRLDLDHSRPDVLEWAAEHGMERGSTTEVMVWGDPLPGDRTRLFNPVMIALG